MSGFTDEQYQRVADRLDVPPRVVRAVAEVESCGEPFLPDGQVPILFEAQWFHAFTGGRYDADHPTISSPRWDKTLYVGGAAEYDRLKIAEDLDHDAALKATSWGAFQVMGMSYAELGYPTVDAFVASMVTEEGQLEAFARFVEHKDLETAMRNLDWSTIARIYNGPGAVESYAPRLEQAYESPPGQGLSPGNHGANVVWLQQKLGIHVDGIYGPATDTAVRQFQANAGLAVDGVAGPLTVARIRDYLGA